MTQVILSLICLAIGITTIAILYRSYVSNLRKKTTHRFSLTPLTKEAGWKWLFTILITIGWIALQYVWPGQNSADENATINLMATYPMPMFIVVSVLGPIYEEFLGRGLFFSYFIKTNTHWAQTLGLLSSSLVFGLLHSVTFSWSTLEYIVSGLVLGCIYLISRNIRFSILAHLINNIIATLG